LDKLDLQKLVPRLRPLGADRRWQTGRTRFWSGEAIATRLTGRRAEARHLLAPVYGWFTEGFNTPDLKEASGLLDELG